MGPEPKFRLLMASILLERDQIPVAISNGELPAPVGHRLQGPRNGCFAGNDGEIFVHVCNRDVNRSRKTGRLVPQILTCEDETGTALGDGDRVLSCRCDAKKKHRFVKIPCLFDVRASQQNGQTHELLRFWETSAPGPRRQSSPPPQLFLSDGFAGHVRPSARGAEVGVQVAEAAGGGCPAGPKYANTPVALGGPVAVLAPQDRAVLSTRA